MDPKNPRSPDEYKSVAGYGEAEFIIEKSRFIGYALPVSSEEEARAFIAELRELHPQATHVCSAWIIGAGGLIRAYTRGAVVALEAARVTTWTRHRALTLTCDYTFQGAVSHQLEHTDWLLDDTVYDDKVHYHLFIPADAEPSAAEQIAGWTNGKAALDWGEVCYKGRK